MKHTLKANYQHINNITKIRKTSYNYAINEYSGKEKPAKPQAFEMN
jgi:hypothetical protein